MIAIIDYGLGNIRAFVNVYKDLGIACKIASQVEDLDGVTKIILPGVGAFDHAMKQLDLSGMRGTLDELVIRGKLPVLGICVGMQILAYSSEEGSSAGLGWIDGKVTKLNPNALQHQTQLPHMGWNDIHPIQNSQLLRGIDENSRFYFLHSYAFHCHEKCDVVAVTDYGGMFPSIVNAENVYGVQFHPEKSHQDGIQLLANFGTL